MGEGCYAKTISNATRRHQASKVTLMRSRREIATHHAVLGNDQIENLLMTTVFSNAPTPGPVLNEVLRVRQKNCIQAPLVPESMKLSD
jgi:hypothetical protein